MTERSATVALPAPDVLGQLKAGTHRQHVQAEQALNLLDPALSQARYAAVLAWLHGHHAALEPAVRATLRAALPAAAWRALDWDERSKLPLLARDLVALGQAPQAAATPPVWLRSEAHAWGAAYVLEGATLGGQLVLRHLRRVGLPDGCLQYYGSYGAQVGTRWRTFGAVLTERHGRSAAPATFAAQAVQAATLTFERLTYPVGHRTELT